MLVFYRHTAQKGLVAITFKKTFATVKIGEFEYIPKFPTSERPEHILDKNVLGVKMRKKF